MAEREAAEPRTLATLASSRPRPALLAALLLPLIGVGLLPQTRGVFGGDEPYVFANLYSPEWRERIFAFNAAFPGRSGGHWYDGYEPYQRRYVRIAPSALMGIEARVFGACPRCFKMVSLGLHLVSCLLGFQLLALWQQDARKAALLMAPIGLHPVVDQPIDWVACQPLIVAMLLTLASTWSWARRCRQGRPGGWAVPALAFAAITSYEGAVAVPLLLFAADAWTRRRHAQASLANGPRWALLAIYPLYAAIAWANVQDASHTDASYRAGAAEFLGILTSDAAASVVRTFVGRPPFVGELTERAADPRVAALLVVAIGLALVRFGRLPATLFGVVVYAALLAPPLLTRAGVSFSNYPSNRTLYLPLIGVAVVAGSLWRGPPRRRAWAVSGLLCGAFAAYHYASAPPVQAAAAHAAMGSAVQRALADVPPGVPIVLIGGSSCGYDPRFDAGPRPVYDLIPLTIPGQVPEIEWLDDWRMRVRSDDGLRVAVSESAPRPGQRLAQRVTDLATTGQQRLELATVTPGLLSPSGSVTELVYRFDAPLTSHVFFSIRGCTLPEHVVPR